MRDSGAALVVTKKIIFTLRRPEHSPSIKPYSKCKVYFRNIGDTNIYLPGFAKRYLQDFLVTVSFEACSVLEIFCLFFVFFVLFCFVLFFYLFSTKIP